MTRNDPSYDFSILKQRELLYDGDASNIDANRVDTVIVVNGTDIGVPWGYYRAADEEKAPVKCVHFVKDCLVFGRSQRDETRRLGTVCTANRQRRLYQRTAVEAKVVYEWVTLRRSLLDMRQAQSRHQ